MRWALLVPGYVKEWHLGIRVCTSGKLFGFISAIPVKTQIKDKEVKMAEVNYLCVHKKLRAKRLAPVLIKELTRIINTSGTFQAIYTAGIVVPRPATTATYWHRTLNPKKLVEVGFSSLPAGVPMAKYVKSHNVEKENELNLLGNVRPMEEKDVKAVTKLLNEYLKRFEVRLKFSEKEIAHMLIPQENLIHSYVVESAETKQITDMVSFYSLPSTILKKIGHSHDRVNVCAC